MELGTEKKDKNPIQKIGFSPDNQDNRKRDSEKKCTYQSEVGDIRSNSNVDDCLGPFHERPQHRPQGVEVEVSTLPTLRLYVLLKVLR